MNKALLKPEALETLVLTAIIGIGKWLLPLLALGMIFITGF